MSADKTLLISDTDNKYNVATLNAATTKLNKTFLNYLTCIFLVLIAFL